MLTKKWSYYAVSLYAGKSLISLLEKIIRINVTDIPILEPSDFKWVQLFENNYTAIQKEYSELLSGNKLPDITEISTEQKSVVERSKWHFFPFYLYGNKVNENLNRCPETARLLNNIPFLTTAFFSVLGPGAIVKKHRGAYKGYLRFHFGVKIPQPNTQCGMCIEGKIYFWENGKALIFDDTFLHEVWNNSAEERVVLYVDFIRPMSKILIYISVALTWLISISPYVQNGLTKLRSAKYNLSYTN